MARGLSNTEIAQQLNISPSTAKTHVSRVLMKLDARDRAQLIVIAYETGLATSLTRPQETSSGQTTGFRPRPQQARHVATIVSSKWRSGGE